ncbi:MAG TPA: hypothetical protein VK921_01715 [Anditalea sp.]|nr:hypothetical protein [Anditalea sp.]
MKSIYLIFLSLSLIYSCQTPKSSNIEYNEAKPRETVSNRQEEVNINEIRPQLNQMAEAARNALDKREINSPTFRGIKVESLVLWSDGDNWPVMLDVTYLNNSSNPKATYYFRDSKLLAVEKAYANFTFKNNKLQVWADEKWVPLKDKTTDQWLDQENYLLKNAKKFLNAFDINYEE